MSDGGLDAVPSEDSMKYEPTPDADTPSQSDFIKRLASLPHTADDGPATILEMGGALGMLNDVIQVAREIVTRDGLGG